MLSSPVQPTPPSRPSRPRPAICGASAPPSVHPLFLSRSGSSWDGSRKGPASQAEQLRGREQGRLHRAPLQRCPWEIFASCPCTFGLRVQRARVSPDSELDGPTNPPHEDTSRHGAESSSWDPMGKWGSVTRWIFSLHLPQFAPNFDGKWNSDCWGEGAGHPPPQSRRPVWSLGAPGGSTSGAAWPQAGW